VKQASLPARPAFGVLAPPALRSMDMAPPLARFLLISCLAAMAAALPSLAAAQPIIPATFYGTASIDGQAVPEGTHVRAFIEGKDCTQLGSNYRTTVLSGGVAEYAIQVMHESQEPGCGTDGSLVTFTVAGRQASQTAAWKAGVQNVNLNVGSGNPVPVPTPSPTPTLEPTAAAATATQAALFTPRPTEDGPPPTDDDTDIRLTPATTGSQVPGDRGSSGGSASGSGDDGVPLIGVIGLAMLALAVVGAVIGFFMSRSRRAPAAPGE